MDGKAKEGGCAISQGVDQPRVINLLINPGISSKYGSVSDEAGGKITPDDKPGIVKEQGGEAFGRYLCKGSKNKAKNNGQKKGLKNKPSGAKNGLFVLGKKIAPNQQVK